MPSEHVGGLPDELHFAEGRVPQPLMRHPERVEPDDPCRLAPRLPGGEGEIDFQVRAVNGIAEGVEERRVALERADRLLPLVAIREGERDVVFVLLRVGILGHVALVDDRHREQGLDLPLDAVHARPFRRPGRGAHLGPARPLGARPGEKLRAGHGVMRCARGEAALGDHLEQRARVGEGQPDGVRGAEDGIEPRHRYARGEERVLSSVRAAREHGTGEQSGAYETRRHGRSLECYPTPPGHGKAAGAWSVGSTCLRSAASHTAYPQLMSRSCSPRSRRFNRVAT